MGLFVNYGALFTAVMTGGNGRYEDGRANALIKQLLDGTGSGQANKWFSSKGRSISASGSEDLDLTGTALKDVLGAALALTKVKLIRVYAEVANVNDVVIGNGTNPLVGGPFGASGAQAIAIKPGGEFLWVDPVTGLTVTGATGDILKAANSSSGTAVVYDVDIIGY